MSKCKNCGYELGAEDKFCKRCGTERSEYIPGCDTCGYEYGPDDIFCKRCGNNLMSSREKEAAARQAESLGQGSSSQGQQEVDEIKVPAYLERTIHRPRKEPVISPRPKKAEKKEPVIEQTEDKPSKQETTLIPNIDKHLRSSDLDDRAVLSEEKKRLIEKSKNMRDALNHEMPEEKEMVYTEEDLHATQMITVGDALLEEGRRRKRKGFRPLRDTTLDEPKTGDKVLGEKSTSSPTKNTNILIGVLALVAVCLVSFIGLKAMADKDKLISSFERAVNEENLAGVSQILISDGVDTGPEDVEPFVKLMNEDTLYSSALISALEEDSIKLSGDKAYESQRPYRLVLTGDKKYVFFDEYKVAVDPMILTMEDEGTEYILAGETISEPLVEKLILPGLYPLSFGGEDYLVNLSTSNELAEGRALNLNLHYLDAVAIVQAEQENTEAMTTEEETEKPAEKFDIQGEEYVFMEGQNMDAIVYVNGKTSELSINQVNDLEAVNLKTGDILKVAYEFPWGTEFSPEVEYTEGSGYIYFEPVVYGEKTLASIVDRVVLMLEEDGIARRESRTDVYTTLIEPETTYAKENIQGNIDSKVIRYRDYENLEIDKESLEIRLEDGTFQAYIGGRIKFLERDITVGEDLADYQLYEREGIQGYHLTYDQEAKDWFVNMWGYTDRWLPFNDTESYAIN